MREQEEWRDVVGYEGLYRVSNFGNVKSLQRKIKTKNGVLRTQKETLLKKEINTNGYFRVMLCDGKTRKHKQVHRLVADAFIPNADNCDCINHIDGNKQNNSVSNLEWCSYSYNAWHSSNILGNKTRSIKVMRDDGKVYDSILDASKENGLSRCAIWNTASKFKESGERRKSNGHYFIRRDIEPEYFM